MKIKKADEADLADILRQAIISKESEKARRCMADIQSPSMLHEALHHVIVYDQMKLFNQGWAHPQAKNVDFYQRRSDLLYQAAVTDRVTFIRKLYPKSRPEEVAEDLAEYGAARALDALLVESIRQRDGLAERFMLTGSHTLPKTTDHLHLRERRDAQALAEHRAERAAHDGFTDTHRKRARARP